MTGATQDIVSSAARWTLLAAILAGLSGMHVLTAEDGSGGHGGLPTISPSGHGDVTEPASAPAPPMPAGMDAIGGLPGIAAVLSADPGPAVVITGRWPAAFCSWSSAAAR